MSVVRDANGTAIKVGDKVRFVGTVEIVNDGTATDGVLGVRVRSTRQPPTHEVSLFMPPGVLEVVED